MEDDENVRGGIGVCVVDELDLRAAGIDMFNAAGVAYSS